MRTKAGIPEWETYFLFLDKLRESGKTNMYGAGSWLEDEFVLDHREARKIVTAWMRAFGGATPPIGAKE